MSEALGKIETTIKAIKIVVIDLKKKVGDLAEDVKNQEADLKKQNDQLQTIAKKVDDAVDITTSKEQMVPAGIDPERLKELDVKIESEIERLNQIEKRLGDFDQTLTALRKDMQELHQRLETGTHSPDTDLSDQIEAKQGEMDNKLLALRDKLDEIEDILAPLKAASPEAPSIAMSQVLERLNTLESVIQKIEPTKPQIQPASVFEPIPRPAPPSEVAPEPSIGTDIVAPTMKDNVRKIIEELVTASAIKIASRLQVSTARIMSVIKELESEGVIVLSGDVETGRCEVKLA